MSHSLFATKPVAASAHVDAGEPAETGDLSGHPTLKRVLTARHLVMLGIGGVIGAGIFVLTGQAAANHAGPAIMLSFVLAGFACAMAGLCYAEFAAMLPVSGSAYSYAYATLGEVVAWFIGWNLVLGISIRGVDGGGRMVWLSQQFSAHDQRLGRRQCRVSGGAFFRATRRLQRAHYADRRARQSACGRDRPRHLLGLLSRHHAIGVAQCRHCRDQAQRDPVVHGIQRAVRQSGELGAVHSTH